MTNIEFINKLLSDIKLTRQKITKHNNIPLSQIKLETDEWKRVDNVACVFVDLENSTQLATGDIQNAMNIFSIYGDSLVKIFNGYNAHYIDIQGDGGFALFDGNNSFCNAYDTAITTNSLFNVCLELGVRIGADIGTIFVKKVGIRGENKEVWLGSPVNIASKLCNLKISDVNNIRISKIFFNKLPNGDKKFFELSNNFYHSSVFWKGIE